MSSNETVMQAGAGWRERLSLATAGWDQYDGCHSWSPWAG